jgi:hypothetical protein
MTRPSEDELAKAKAMWESGSTDAQVAAAMKWKHTKAWEIRKYMLQLPANRKWADEHKGPRK